MASNESNMLLIFRSFVAGRLSIERLFNPLLLYRDGLVLPKQSNNIIGFLKFLFFLAKINSRLIHITGDVHYVSFLLFWKKSILTIHDLNNYEKLKGVKKMIYGFIWFWLPLRTSNLITVISPYTKLQLQQHFNIDSNKLIVIDNTFSEIEKIIIDKDSSVFTILVVGTEENKNLIGLVKAISGLNAIVVRIIGRLDDNKTNMLHIHNINYVNLFNISKNELAIEYNKADMLYFVSTKEGFGLPILEAQSVGLPVLTSNTTAMPYVLGKGGVKVSPYDIKSIKDGVTKYMNNDIFKEKMIRLGYENIRRFDKQVFIDKYINLYSTYE